MTSQERHTIRQDPDGFAIHVDVMTYDNRRHVNIIVGNRAINLFDDEIDAVIAALSQVGEPLGGTDRPTQTSGVVERHGV
jgi:hypothetical protein